MRIRKRCGILYIILAELEESLTLEALNCAAMSVNTLPAKNEEYATQEYWYASDRSHMMCYQTITTSQGPKIRAVSPLPPDRRLRG